MLTISECKAMGRVLLLVHLCGAVAGCNGGGQSATDDEQQPGTLGAVEQDAPSASETSSGAATASEVSEAQTLMDVTIGAEITKLTGGFGNMAISQANGESEQSLTLSVSAREAGVQLGIQVILLGTLDASALNREYPIEEVHAGDPVQVIVTLNGNPVTSGGTVELSGMSEENLRGSVVATGPDGSDVVAQFSSNLAVNCFIVAGETQENPHVGQPDSVTMVSDENLASAFCKDTMQVLGGD